MPERNALCVDCGAGTTGTANVLASTYEHSIALDINPVHGHCEPNVRKVAGSANHLRFEEGSVDLLISIQAFHNFDRDKHLSEALRVLRPGGVFAALCWGEVDIPAPVKHAYTPVFEAIDPCWETARADVMAGYPGISIPGEAMTLPETYRSHWFDLDQFERYLATWSGLQAALSAGVEIPEPKDNDLERIDHVFELRWPLIGKVFRV
ncbi:class I SAM-dependent methyltransferase [Roseibium sp. MMSF_3544]|uniref:class I SAM-dependent methyltransferase n=1 Tax=unclassified Roseibium TaxID=2629323 RepID=UPI00273F7CDF|nr:class I SAM-dependent methyltransferase [Roseibium sp. MMSF_3544]